MDNLKACQEGPRSCLYNL